MSIIDNVRSREPQIKTLVHNAMLMGLHTNKNFLEYLFKKEFLTFYNSRTNPDQRVKDQFYQLLTLFKEKYKDNWDLGFEWDGDYYIPYFKVLYPEVHITNSKGHYHFIRDLVVVHKVAYSSRSGQGDPYTRGHVYTKHPYGGRFTKTNIEIAGAYQQSHLSGHTGWLSDPFYTSEFCVGGDTDVSRMIAEFEVEMDWDRYELYLFCIDSMITWESLEGVPFRKIAEIATTVNPRVTTVNSSRVEDVIDRILVDKMPLDVDFYIEKDRIRILPNERANAFIKAIVLRIFSFEKYKSILVSRLSNTFDTYCAMRADEVQYLNPIIDAKAHYTIFRGKKVFAKVYKEDKRNHKPLSIDDYIVYPKFLKDVLSKLEYRIYEKAVTQSGVKMLDSLSNANRSVTSDSISM